MTENVKKATNHKQVKMLPHSSKADSTKSIPKISVITPAYNAEKYIGETIESLQAQTFTDYEHIIVNDGSTDSTVTIIEKYAKEDDRIRLISQKNAGAAAARNKGLECARGEYITFVDGDDFIEVDTFSTLISTALERGNDLICFRKDLYHENTGERTSESFFYNNSKLPQVFCPTTDIGYEVFFFTSAPLDVVGFYSRVFLTQNGLNFNTKFQRNEDFLFKAAALLCAKKVSFIDMVLYHYRVGMKGNASSTLDAHKEVGWKILLELQCLIKQGGYSGDVAKSLQIISYEFLWHYIANMKSYEGQKYAFEKTKDVALRLGLNSMSDPGDIYTGINFYKSMQRAISNDFSQYLWDTLSERKRHIVDLTNRVNRLDRAVLVEAQRVEVLSAQLDAIRSSPQRRFARTLKNLLKRACRAIGLR